MGSMFIKFSAFLLKNKVCIILIEFCHIQIQLIAFLTYFVSQFVLC
jgi:hypothetical protein